jgi:hypothetical protein
MILLIELPALLGRSDHRSRGRARVEAAQREPEPTANEIIYDRMSASSRSLEGGSREAPQNPKSPPKAQGSHFK